ncbi:MAG: DNA repair protein RecO [Candidatus Terrybacteria bacterium RIFCSPHIGHO2_01_FULL_48_17]|uniref:DNA repair protein RecO n=1 Tax=Candidatus Terrybacteria bacterium RIFCSPHIGHO2_01_FULL_48_17 TaxID=1802362 RepID=A0A1G2PKP0_9BACT|nr:MAG: DNA repair protein RecO [Candidatus Terrybacteria bacterium RIFCSPHIGHO2_01_FULL_48_17]OHA53726.1 MAG: DNA repair protein RecO [Candidatus Terrybacteria bacterium RIFCSPLOWO2_01_FULL_48_14]
MRALILQTESVGEADWEITMLSEELGKLRVKAKGAAKMESKLRAGILPFVTSDVMLHPQKNGGFLLKTAAPYVERLSIRESLCALSVAEVFAEILLAITGEGIVDEKLFLFAEKAFDALEEGKDPVTVFLYAVSAFIREAGLAPPKNAHDLPLFMQEHFEYPLGSFSFMQKACHEVKYRSDAQETVFI